MIVRYTLIWLAATVLSLSVSVFSPISIKTAAVQAALHFILFASFISLSPVRRFLAGIPKSYVWTVVAFYALATVGQLVSRPRDTFPFVTWNMYSSTVKTQEHFFLELYGVRDDGAKTRLNVARIFPSLVNARLHHMLLEIGEIAFPEALDVNRSTGGLVKTGLRKRLKSIRRPDFLRGTHALSETEAQGQLRDTLLSIGQVHNKRGRDKVNVVELYACQIDLRRMPGAPVERQLLLSVPVGASS